MKTLAGYADWMKGMFTPFPDARYELKSFATDPERNNVSAFAVFHATHTGPGGPVPPSGKSLKTEVVLGESFCELDAGGRDGFRVGAVRSDRSRRTNASPLIVPLRG